jgi:oxygen-independent coproporphyrinogen III oxidase
VAGLYLHIPFCRKLCYYCDFHFTVSLKDKSRLVDALIMEIRNRKDEYNDLVFDTIYFGGGTPSVLDIKEVESIFEAINRNCRIASNPEITFEANPDDLNLDYLNNLKSNTPINRLSIGIQSFVDKHLKLMNRRHNSIEAIESINRSRLTGFSNINIDLIYGIPGMSLSTWENNLKIFKSLEVEHLSAYHLTFEPKTVFSHYLKKGKIKQIKENLSLRQFELLQNFAEEAAYDHYEISNFARNGNYSRHNLAYWTGKPYIGIGPSAHSFSINERRWNISNNTKYCASILQNVNDYFEKEIIDLRTAYNDYLLTSLRTKWGINREVLKLKYGEKYLDYFNSLSEKFISDGTIITENQISFLSAKGKFIADYIISELMMVD